MWFLFASEGGKGVYKCLLIDDEMDQRRYRVTANNCLPIGTG